MASTVNAAFAEFMRDYVRLDNGRNDVAKRSKGYLVEQVTKFPDDGRFPRYYETVSIDYGSYSRRTKIRPLDDIDLMFVLHAEGGQLDARYDGTFDISLPSLQNNLGSLCFDNSNILNSRKVINKFITYLGNLGDYEKADIKRNQEAATLKLKSYEWVYDLVPAFITNKATLGEYFLIPDGNGRWKKTDPRIDKERTTRISGKQIVSVLDIVRVMKYWTARPTMPTVSSYLMENIILNHYDANHSATALINVELPSMFALVYHQIYQRVNDPKGFQGDINTLSWDDRKPVQQRAEQDYHRAVEARRLEDGGNHRASIAKWREIFGPNFPSYTA
jgi:hypothetical protein